MQWTTDRCQPAQIKETIRVRKNVTWSILVFLKWFTYYWGRDWRSYVYKVNVFISEVGSFMFYFLLLLSFLLLFKFFFFFFFFFLFTLGTGECLTPFSFVIPKVISQKYYFYFPFFAFLPLHIAVIMAMNDLPILTHCGKRKEHSYINF